MQKESAQIKLTGPMVGSQNGSLNSSTRTCNGELNDIQYCNLENNIQCIVCSKLFIQVVLQQGFIRNLDSFSVRFHSDLNLLKKDCLQRQLMRIQKLKSKYMLIEHLITYFKNMVQVIQYSKILLRSLNPVLNKEALFDSKALGKSDSFFIQTYDKKYFIKTISEQEVNNFKEFLPSYHTHITTKLSYLSIVVGLFKIQIADQFPFFVMIIKNIARDESYSCKYDLKGSKRKTMQKSEIMLHHEYQLVEIEEGRNSLGDQPQAQASQENFEFLQIIPNISSNQASSSRKQTSSVQPQRNLIYKEIDFEIQKEYLEMDSLEHKLFFTTIEEDVNILRQNQILDYSLILFYFDTQPFYSYGIIDFTQKYTLDKKCEVCFKKTLCQKDFSVIPPSQYAERFLRFLQEHIKPISQVENLQTK